MPFGGLVGNHLAGVGCHHRDTRDARGLAGVLCGLSLDMGLVGEGPVWDGDRWVQRFSAVTRGSDGQLESVTREISASTREGLAEQVEKLDLLDGDSS